MNSYISVAKFISRCINIITQTIPKRICKDYFSLVYRKASDYRKRQKRDEKFIGINGV